MAQAGEYSDCSNISICLLAKNWISRMLCGKGHCHNTKSIWPAKILVFIDKYATVNFPNIIIKMRSPTLFYF